MAKIPQAQSQVQITRQAPAVREGPGIFSDRVAQETKKLGQTIAVIAQKFQDAAALAQATKASNAGKRQLEQLKLDAATTEDFGNVQQFTDKISKIREESANLITMPRARQEFQRSFDRDAIATEFSIKNTLRARTVDDAKAQMLENIDLIKDTSLDRNTELSDLLAKNVGNLIISKEAAFKLKKKTLKSWQEIDIRNAIASDAETAKDQITAGIFGKLSASETSDWLNAAEKQQKRNKEIAEKKRDETWLQNGGQVIENLEKTSVEDIIQLVTNGQIDPDFANDIIKWKTDPDAVQYETDKAIWNEIVRDSVSPEQDLRLFQRRIAKAVADKSIQAEDAANLSVQVKALFDSAIKFKSKPNRFHQAVGVAMDFFESFAKSQGLDLVRIPFELSKRLTKAIADKNITTPEAVKEEADSITKETIRDNFDWISNIPEKGQVMTDKNGKKVRVFPDGSIEEVK